MDENLEAELYEMDKPLPPYQQAIKAIVPDANPRHVEAEMRLIYGTLDGLSKSEFAQAARQCAWEANEDGPEAAEALAQSFGL